jgi:hypothetical protein
VKWRASTEFEEGRFEGKGTIRHKKIYEKIQAIGGLQAGYRERDG